MRIPTWLIVAFSLAVPRRHHGGGGGSSGRQGKGGGRRVLRVPWRRWRRDRGRARGRQERPEPGPEPDLYLQFQLVFFRKGVRKNEVMNAMAEQLSDDDLRNVSAYFASLPAPNAPPPPDAAPKDTELGSKIAQGIHCTNCHGDHFEGVDNIARLAGQREDYVYEALRDFKSGARTSTGAAGHGGGGVSARRRGDEGAGPLRVAATLTLRRAGRLLAAKSGAREAVVTFASEGPLHRRTKLTPPPAKPRRVLFVSC